MNNVVDPIFGATAGIGKGIADIIRGEPGAWPKLLIPVVLAIVVVFGTRWLMSRR